MNRISSKVVEVNLEDVANKMNGYSFNEQIMMANVNILNRVHLKDETRKELSLKLDVVILVLIKSGTLTITIDYITYTLKENTMILLSPYNIITTTDPTPDSRYFVLMAKRDFLEENAANLNLSIKPYELFKKEPSIPYITLKENQAEMLNKWFQTIYNYLKEDEKRFKLTLLHKTFSILLIEIFNVILDKREEEVKFGKGENEEKRNITDRKIEITRKFILLLHQYGEKEHKTTFYADKLFISAQYLSIILKENTNNNTSKWIANHLVNRAKILFRANHSITEVTEQLNFSDQSSFGKFFKKHAGVSPKKYIGSLR